MLKYENKPEIVIDIATWYPWALQRLGFEYNNETFGERRAVESFFSKLKERTLNSILPLTKS